MNFFSGRNLVLHHCVHRRHHGRGVLLRRCRGVPRHEEPVPVAVLLPVVADRVGVGWLYLGLPDRCSGRCGVCCFGGVLTIRVNSSFLRQLRRVCIKGMFFWPYFFMKRFAIRGTGGFTTVLTQRFSNHPAPSTQCEGFI